MSPSARNTEHTHIGTPTPLALEHARETPRLGEFRPYIAHNSIARARQ